MQRVIHTVAESGAGVDDVAVTGDDITIQTGNESGPGKILLVEAFLFGRGVIPTDGGRDLLDFGKGNDDVFINRRREGPVHAGAKEGILAVPDRFAEPEDDGPL